MRPDVKKKRKKKKEKKENQHQLTRNDMHLLTSSLGQNCRKTGHKSKQKCIMLDAMLHSS